MDEKLLNVSQVSLLVGSSIQTITSWYKWKELHPDNPLVKFLPDYTRGERRTRYWKQSDVWLLMKFKEIINHGRNGIMGDVTQKYCYKNKAQA